MEGWIKAVDKMYIGIQIHEGVRRTLGGVVGYIMGGGVNRGVCFWCTPHAHIIGIYVHRAAAAG